MNNRNVNSQLGSVIDQLGQDKNSDQLKSDRAELDKKIVDLLMKQQSTIAGLQKGTGAAPVANTSTAKKVGNVNTGFYADVVGGSKPRLRSGDGAAGIGAKIYAVIRQDIEHRKLKTELKHNFEKDHFDNEEKRQKELIDTIKGRGKPKVPKPGRDEKGRFVKKTPEEAPAGKAPAPEAPAGKAPAPAPAPAAKPAPAPAPTPAPAVKPVPKVEAKPTTAVKAPEVKAPQAAVPTVTKAAEVTKVLPTAAKIVIGAAAAAVPLGAVSAKEESAKGGVATVSGGMGGKDPGGVSYGKYQLASKTGTMQSFLSSTYGKPFASDFASLTPGTPEFTAVYKSIANNRKEEFEKAQQDFIEKTHYKPVEDYAKKKGLDVSNQGVKEALFSASVQHGLEGNQKIIDGALTILQGSTDAKSEISALYKSRGNYVSSLKKLDEKIKKSILDRYSRESKDALSYVDKNDSGDKLNKDSTENKDLKKKSGQTTIISNNSTTNNIVGGKSTPQVLTTATPSEKPPILGN